MPVTGLSPKEVVHQELHKFKHHTLHSGSKHGPLVHSRPQAIAIALSEARRAHRADGGGLAGSPTLPLGALAWPASYGLLNSGQASPRESLLSGFGYSGQNASPSAISSSQPMAGMMGAPIGFAPAPASAQPAPSTGQPPVISSTPAAAPPVQPMNGQPPGSWIPPTFSAGNWGSAPGRQFGGGMTRAPNPNWMVRNEARSMLHSGPISSIVPGRTDRHNVHVGSGAYVVPADAVSHLGQNNSKAGQVILSHMFGGQGPYGMGKDMAIRHGPGAPTPRRPQTTQAVHLPKFQSAGGGKGDKTGEPVPIVVAGGEFTIPPQAVAAVGGGDIKRGHRLLDKWVLSLRQKHIATLKGLPPPAKS